jgi:hypothetical protein
MRTEYLENVGTDRDITLKLKRKKIMEGYGLDSSSCCEHDNKPSYSI